MRDFFAYTTTAWLEGEDTNARIGGYHFPLLRKANDDMTQAEYAAEDLAREEDAKPRVFRRD